jgi:hypothetical protein
MIGAHLVGSVPLRDPESVFRTVAATLGPYLKRIPDGESGPRKDWIAWQYGVLATTAGLEPIPSGDRGYLRRQLVRCTAPPRFGPLGYAEAARASYAIFDRLQRAGVIPHATRFQVSLPTPLAPVTVFVAPDDRPIVEPAYEARMLAELAEITAAIPHDRLAIQWDVAVEVGLLEGAWPAHFSDIELGITTRLARLGSAVPRGVELGFHLCYGDFGHRHFTNPRDATTLVRLANVLPRPMSWVHLPVPITWTDARAFAPLAELSLDADVYLGLVHIADGVAGARARATLASTYVPELGIATECGWGRRPADSVQPLLDLHAAVLR